MHQSYPRKRYADYNALQPSVHWAQLHSREPNFSWSRRIYDFELLYVIQGEISAQLDKVEHFVPSGSLLFVPAGVYHKITVLTEPYAQFLGIHFDFFDELEVVYDADIIVDEDNVYPDNFCDEPLLDGMEIFSGEPFINPPPQIISLMEFIIQEFDVQKPVNLLACKGMLLQIFSLLMKYHEEKSRFIHTRYETHLIQLVHEIENNLAWKWSSTEMAKYLNVHEDYMGKMFKDMMGMTPNKYLQNLRHQHAKKLLRETDLKIQAIAQESGYTDFHYFSRVFKKLEGITAQQYRRFSQIY